ncbi:MAG: hypothetical protein M1829_001841 [Trizodia sp. TS-e1964]|nr:MAG: hypothetical protein M1829_001841 [Trizodia sp. TS-e1964]
MAWRSSGTTNASLVAALLRNSLLDPAHQAAMLAIDRADYAPTAPYEDAPQPLGFGATISAPHMHAMALAQLRAFARPGAQVLDVGSGSGYLTAVLGELVKPGGRVLGIEHVPELVALAEGNMRKSLAGSEALESGRVRFELGDGRLGVGGPWDAIHVGAAADDEVVDRLVATLGVPGR